MAVRFGRLVFFGIIALAVSALVLYTRRTSHLDEATEPIQWNQVKHRKTPLHQDEDGTIIHGIEGENEGEGERAEAKLAKVDCDPKAWDPNHGHRGPASKLLMLFPTFGPNNQYYAFKETIIMSQVINRKLALPAFYHHRWVGKNATYHFNTTFNPEPFFRYMNVVSMEEFARECHDKLTILYIHGKHPDWDIRQRIYMEENGLGEPFEVVYPDGNRRKYNPYVNSEQEIREFFEGYMDRDCVGIGFPFRNVGSQELQERILQTSCVFQHSELVHELAAQVLEDVNLNPEHYLGAHMRESEEGCQVEPPRFHKGFDMCFGTSAFNWVRSDDVVEALRLALQQKKLTRIFLATDSAEEHLIAKLRKQLPLVTARDSPTLLGIKDSYIRSLVEQNIMMRSKVFAGSYYSTWSQFIAHWWDHNPHKLRANNQWLENVMRNFGKTIETHHNGDEYVKVNYTEMGLLKNYLKDFKVNCEGTLKKFSEFNNNDASTWKVCLNTPKLTVLSSRLGTSKEKMKMEIELAKEGHKVTYLNHDLIEQMSADLKAVGIESLKLKLGKGDYENTLTFASVLKSQNLSSVDLLVLDLYQREWQVLDKMIEDGSILKVRQITLRAEFKPIWEDNVLNWVKELNARAILHLDSFMEMERLGLKIMHAEKDAASNDESQWMITWLNPNP